MEIKHIYWFSYYNLDEPSVRYRAKYVLNKLSNDFGIKYDLIIPSYKPSRIIHFLFIFFQVLLFRKKSSIIVFQKIYSNGIYAHLLKLLLMHQSANTIYDIDDAEYTRRPVSTMHYFMKKSTACTVGSDELKNYVLQFNSNVHLLTSPVIQHSSKKLDKEKIFTIGWIGYYGAHRSNLMNYAFPAIKESNKPIILKILGVKSQEEIDDIKNYFHKNNLVTIIAPLHLNWHNENEIYEIIKSFDVGISPLINNEFNRAKSAFKLKQCMSCGVPVIASDVGENNRFIKHGINGFICKSIDDFKSYISEVQKLDWNQYNNLSTNAYSTRENFSIELYCKNILNVLHQ